MLKNVAWRTARGGGACAGRGQSGAVLVCRGPGLLRVPFNCDNFDYGGTLTHSHAPTAAPRKTLNTHAVLFTLGEIQGEGLCNQEENDKRFNQGRANTN